MGGGKDYKSNNYATRHRGWCMAYEENFEKMPPTLQEMALTKDKMEKEVVQISDSRQISNFNLRLIFSARIII